MQLPSGDRPIDGLDKGKSDRKCILQLVVDGGSYSRMHRKITSFDRAATAKGDFPFINNALLLR